MIAKPSRPARTVRSLPPARRRPARAPLVVIDAAGVEAGVFVEWTEYLALLDLLAAPRRPALLPTYWRRAIEDCSEAALTGPHVS